MNRRQRRHHLQPPGTPPPPPAGLATSLAPATVSGVAEDHAYEQFFFDDSTVETLLTLLSRYRRPLLFCAPSVAVAASKAGLPYRLLDRDDRFGFLEGFRVFSIERAEQLAVQCVGDYDYDAVLCDPPFSNIEVQQVRDVLDILASAGSDEQERRRRARAPLYFAFNQKRESELLRSFGDRQLVGKAALGYASVRQKTQKALCLYHFEAAAANVDPSSGPTLPKRDPE